MARTAQPRGASALAPAGANATSNGEPVQEVDPTSELRDQVLVAAFPGSSPEVHLASLVREQRAVTFREASIVGGGEVSMGATRTVALVDVGSVNSRDGVTTLLAHDKQILVQMHHETAEDQQAWVSILRLLVSGCGTGGEPDEEDLRMLQARSQQLQNRVGALEVISKRRDSHLQKMMQRLDGATQMLTAVQEMCVQQRRVLDAQEVALVELKRECGEGAGEDIEDAPTAAEPKKDQELQQEEQQEQQRKETLQAEIEAKTQEMMELLEQAAGMQQRLEALQAAPNTSEAAVCITGDECEDVLRGSTDTHPNASVAVSRKPAAVVPFGAPGNRGEEHEDVIGADPDANAAPDSNANAGDESVDADLQRLHQLQAEKKHFEGMLRESQQEHEDLLRRLNDMRSLMTALGIQDIPDEIASNSSADAADCENECKAAS